MSLMELPEELQKELEVIFDEMESRFEDGNTEEITLNGIEYVIYPVSHFKNIRDLITRVIDKVYAYGRLEGSK